MALIGMDTSAIRSLASSIESQSQAVLSVMAAVDQLTNHLQSLWAGSDADEFHGWWTSQYRPGLIAAEAALTALAHSARDNALEQDQASGVKPGEASFLAGRISVDSRSVMQTLAQTSDRWGWIAAPLLGSLPAVGSVIGDVNKADSYARAVQAIRDHDRQDAFTDVSSVVQGDLANLTGVAIHDKCPEIALPLGLLTADATIYTHVEAAGHAIHWGYTIHHLSELDPIAPGAAGAVWGAEKSGLTALAKDLTGDAVTTGGAALSPSKDAAE